MGIRVYSGINLTEVEWRPIIAISKQQKGCEMADESNTNYEETVGKALAGLVDAARPVEERYAELLALDENHFVRDSRLPAARVMDIWASDKVSESWKRNTLKRMMHRNSFYGVMFVPLDLEFDCPLNRDMLELMWDQKYDELEGAAFAEKLAEAERRDAGFWNAFLRQFLYTENYDEAYAPARWDFRRGVEFIERRCPGTVASFSDRFGNNALMYTFGAMVESNTYYTLRTPYGIAMARDDMAVLEQLGCSLEAKNIFGISPAMMMRWTEGMMSQFGDNEDDCRGDVYGC